MMMKDAEVVFMYSFSSHTALGAKLINLTESV